MDQIQENKKKIFFQGVLNRPPFSLSIPEGSCIYQGSATKLFPSLAEVELICPSSFNPADYLLKISRNDYGLHNPTLTDNILNGASSERIQKSRNPLEIPIDDEAFQGRTEKIEFW